MKSGPGSSAAVIITALGEHAIHLPSARTLGRVLKVTLAPPLRAEEPLVPGTGSFFS